jgi:SAM-dependent methyltransferase
MSAGHGLGEQRLVGPQTARSAAAYLSYSRLFPDLEELGRRYGRGVLVDLGCGNQPFLSYFQPYITHYIGLDPDRSNRNLDLVADSLQLPIADQAADTILCTQVLEHVPRPWQLFQEAARILRPGGHLILTAPMYWPLHEVPYDYFRYTPYGLRALTEQVGLEVKELRQEGGAWLNWGQCTALLLRHLRQPLLRTLLTSLVNRASDLLDRRFPIAEDTNNLALVARKL